MEESPIVHAQSTIQLSELDDIQFQRSMSLPRGFGGQKQDSGIHYGAVVPPPRSDSMHALKNMIVRRQKIKVNCNNKQYLRNSSMEFKLCTVELYYVIFVNIPLLRYSILTIVISR